MFGFGEAQRRAQLDNLDREFMLHNYQQFAPWQWLAPFQQSVYGIPGESFGSSTSRSTSRGSSGGFNLGLAQPPFWR